MSQPTSTSAAQPSLRVRAQRLAGRFKLDSHHAIERFGVIMAVLALTGAIVLGTAGVQAFRHTRVQLGNTAVWTPTFTTSRTHQQGTVDGVYVNRDRTRAMILMHFADDAKISYQASDYTAFLMGSATNLSTVPIDTPGITGSVEMFGSTGYMGVVLDATQPFTSQVLNLTMRARSQLVDSADSDAGSASSDANSESAALQAGDPSFNKFDQWRIYVNPGAGGTRYLSSLDQAQLRPDDIYYQTVLASQEKAAKAALDAQLVKMRADLAQISAANTSLLTTKVDGLFIRPPKVPAIIADDKVTGVSATEANHGNGGASTLRLVTTTTVPGGVRLNWRDGSVQKGYLDQVVPAGQSYVSYLSKLSSASADTNGNDSSAVDQMTWTLSNGTDLTTVANSDGAPAEAAMQPLVTLMNTLNTAYQAYYTDKASYQTDLSMALLTLDVTLRDVATNSTSRTGHGALIL